MAAFVGAVIFIMAHIARANQPYKDIIARAQNDPRVVEALGAPVEPGWLMGGKGSTPKLGGTSQMKLTIPLRGSKQNGVIDASAMKDDNEPWRYGRLVMTPDRGEPIDLLAAPPRTGSPDA